MDKYQNRCEDQTDFDQDSSFDSEQTIFDEKINLYKYRDASDTDQILRSESKSIAGSLDFYQNIYSTDNHQATFQSSLDIPSHIFPSIQALYQQAIFQSLLKRKPNAMYLNASIKIHQANLATREWKFAFLKKLSSRGQKSKNYLVRAEKNMLVNQINKKEIEPREITYFQCECGRSSMYIKNIKSHLKKTAHKLVISIDPKRERKYQSRIYDEIGREIKIEDFDQNWLYKSFQMIFVDAQIHQSQVHQKKNKQFILQVLKLKDVEEIREKIYEKQIQNWFLKRLIKIYRLLHEIHKGKQNFCHKSLDFEEHTSLFALGLTNFMTKNRKTIFAEISRREFSSVLSFVKNTLKDFVVKFKKNRGIKPTNLQLVKKISTLIRDLLFRYLKSFDYIDLNDLREPQDLNDE